MSAERTPAEIVKDLRDLVSDTEIAGHATGTVSEADQLVALFNEAAVLIERLTGENERLAAAVAELDEMIEGPLDAELTAYETQLATNDARLAAIEAALPDCPTCGGTGKVAHCWECAASEFEFTDPCPDCDGTGKVSPAHLAALWQAVRDRMLFVTLDPEDAWTPKQNLAVERVVTYLRAVGR